MFSIQAVYKEILKMIFNELLAKAMHHVSSSALEKIKLMLLNFYTADDILNAKKAL